MEQKSGKLIITDNGKLVLSGETFDDHGSYAFEAYVDTGSSLTLTLVRGLADAVCAPVEEEISISIGAGSANIRAQIRKMNLRFGDLVLKDYKVTVIEGDRNIIGMKFFQDVGTIMVIDFHKNKTVGGLISNNRRLSQAIGMTAHCFLSHAIDISKSNEPCLVCGATSD